MYLNFIQIKFVQLKKKKSLRTTEQDRKPEIKIIHIWAINLCHESQEYTMEKDGLFNNWYWGNRLFILHHTQKPPQNILKT